MNKYYIVQGFETNCTPLTAKFTLKEIMSNTGVNADTEMFYALQEMHGDKIIDMVPNGSPMTVYLSRDNSRSKGVIACVSYDMYKAVPEFNFNFNEK